MILIIYLFFSSECFCGDVTPPESAKTTEASCDMKCPGNSTKICGGYFTMNIYETGLTSMIHFKLLPQSLRQ